MKLSTKFGITALILLATVPHFVMPIGWMLGYHMPLGTSLIGMLGLLAAIAIGLIWGIFANDL